MYIYVHIYIYIYKIINKLAARASQPAEPPPASAHDLRMGARRYDC